jgi:hypothetical protein
MLTPDPLLEARCSPQDARFALHGSGDFIGDCGCSPEQPQGRASSSRTRPAGEGEGPTGEGEGPKSAKITKASRPALDETVEVLKANPKYHVTIEGHTDDRGMREHNVALSQKRADSVADYLVRHGIERDRVHTRGRGPDKPVADNSTAEGRAQNRRIEFKLRKRTARKSKGST